MNVLQYRTYILLHCFLNSVTFGCTSDIDLKSFVAFMQTEKDNLSILVYTKFSQEGCLFFNAIEVHSTVTSG